jgi:hypothetical protein
MSVRFAISSILVLGLAGCSSGGGITTGALLGGDEQKSATTAAAQPSNDPTARALQVGTLSARAAKCGYNFDAAALKSNYLAFEAAQGAQVADLGRLEMVYDTGFNGVSKAAATDPNYCNPKRTAEIKADLTRHLAGDYSVQQKVAKVEEQGFFSGFFDGDSVESGPSFGSDDWWSSQADKVR